MKARIIRALVALGLTLAAFTAAPAATSAACSDPLTANSLHVYRSASGVEADWSFTVGAGCTTTARVTIYRPNRDGDDPRSEVHDQSPALTLGPGSYTLNALVVTGRIVDAVLTVDGRIYGIERFDPALVQ